MAISINALEHPAQSVASFRSYFEQRVVDLQIPTQGCGAALQILMQADPSALCHLAEVVSDLPAAVFDDGDADRGERLKAGALDFVTAIAELMAGYGAG